MKKIKKVFEISKYENWTNVLNRIKREEQQWIYSLLIIYGAILWFQTHCSKSYIIKDFDVSLLVILLLNIIISFIWTYQLLNLRAQYYGALIEVIKIQQKFDDLDGKKWEIWFQNFTEWRKIATKPNESKLVEFLLICGLIFTSAVLSIIEQISKWDWSFFIYIILYLFLILFIPFCLYPRLDKKKLEKIYNEGDLPLKRTK